MVGRRSSVSSGRGRGGGLALGQFSSSCVCPPSAGKPSRHRKICILHASHHHETIMRGPTQPITAAAAAVAVLSSTFPCTSSAFSATSHNIAFSSARAFHTRTSLHSSLDSDPLGPIPTAPARQRKKKLKTYQRYLEIACWKNDDIRDLQPVLQAVGDACKQINRIVQRAQTDDLYGAAVGADGEQLDENVQGEVQQKLDVVCNTIMLKSFCGCSSSIAAVASEEEDLPRTCCDVMNDSAFAVGDYVAVFDPIDGSKNIDSSLPVGTVFGIYKAAPGTDAGEASFMQTGDSGLVAAGYCLYSATTVLVVTMGSGVDGFTLDPDKGVFLHTHEDIRIPKTGPIYSFNEANFRDFSNPVKNYLASLKEGTSPSAVKTRSSARYVGALVADVHNVLINGGIYGYPATRSNPDGKLRLLYECCPMAMIMEEAGGAASTGAGRILAVQPTEIHQRVSTFLGSIENVFELDQFHQYYDDEDAQ